MEQKTLSLLIIVGVAAVVLISLALSFNKGPIITEIPLGQAPTSSPNSASSGETTNSQNAFVE
ncbi:MAG: hypothetical protein AAB903_00335 [Patescibacteria group bacterium]